MSLLVKRVEKPWGHEIIYAHTDHYAGKILVINPGETLSLQYHEMKEESIYVIEGEMQLEVGDTSSRRILKMVQGDAFHIEPKTVHRFSTETGCKLAEVSTPQLDDVVRLEDRYGRTGS